MNFWLWFQLNLFTLLVFALQCHIWKFHITKMKAAYLSSHLAEPVTSYFLQRAFYLPVLVKGFSFETEHKLLYFRLSSGSMQSHSATGSPKQQVPLLANLQNPYNFSVMIYFILINHKHAKSASIDKFSMYSWSSVSKYIFW